MTSSLVEDDTDVGFLQFSSYTYIIQARALCYFKLAIIEEIMQLLDSAGCLSDGTFEFNYYNHLPWPAKS